MEWYILIETVIIPAKNVPVKRPKSARVMASFTETPR
jgi:hypothetical protein